MEVQRLFLTEDLPNLDDLANLCYIFFLLLSTLCRYYIYLHLQPSPQSLFLDLECFFFSVFGTDFPSFAENPTSLTALIKVADVVVPAKVTIAFLFFKSTVASFTPSTCFNAFSTVLAHDSHVIPVIFSMIVFVLSTEKAERAKISVKNRTIFFIFSS
jgi:hypothetical protein